MYRWPLSRRGLSRNRGGLLVAAMVACWRAASAFPYRTHSKTAPFNRTHRQARHARSRNSTLRDPKCDLPHAAASERRVGSPCPPHLVPAGSRRRRRGTFQAKEARPPRDCRGSRARRPWRCSTPRSFSARGPNATPAPSKAAAARVRLEAAADDGAQSGAPAPARASQAGIRLVHQRCSAGTGRGHTGKLAPPTP